MNSWLQVHSTFVSLRISRSYRPDKGAVSGRNGGRYLGNRGRRRRHFARRTGPDTCRVGYRRWRPHTCQDPPVGIDGPRLGALILGRSNSAPLQHFRSRDIFRQHVFGRLLSSADSEGVELQWNGVRGLGVGEVAFAGRRGGEDSEAGVAGG